MARLVLCTEHPSADLHDAMTEPLWEGLAAATVENSLVPVDEQGVDTYLVEMGLLSRTGHPAFQTPACPAPLMAPSAAPAPPSPAKPTEDIP